MVPASFRSHARLSPPRPGSSIAAVEPASHRTARWPREALFTYLTEPPTAVPAELTAWAAPLLWPPMPVPRVPSTVGVVDPFSQRRGCEPIGSLVPLR